MDDLLIDVVELIQHNSNTVVLCGAGISTATGIPDFRSENSGLWSEQDPFEVASIWGFNRQPEHFFHWILPLAQKMVQARPNPAHIALSAMEKRGYIDTLNTQNIDGLHQAAGSQIVVELHASWSRVKCISYRKDFEPHAFLERKKNYQGARIAAWS
jgi:NAD-dependent deacetylase